MFNPQLDVNKYKIELRLDTNNKDIYAWKEIDALDLKNNDFFRAFDSDGQPVTDEFDKSTFRALSDPYRDELGFVVINTMGVN